MTDPLAHVDEGRVPRRINVAVDLEEVAALERMILVDGVSLTEAVRRLLGYGDYIARAIVDDGAKVFIRGADGSEREMLLIRGQAGE